MDKKFAPVRFDPQPQHRVRDATGKIDITFPFGTLEQSSAIYTDIYQTTIRTSSFVKNYLSKLRISTFPFGTIPNGQIRLRYPKSVCTHELLSQSKFQIPTANGLGAFVGGLARGARAITYNFARLSPVNATFVSAILTLNVPKTPFALVYSETCIRNASFEACSRARRTRGLFIRSMQNSSRRSYAYPWLSSVCTTCALPRVVTRTNIKATPRVGESNERNIRLFLSVRQFSLRRIR